MEGFSAASTRPGSAAITPGSQQFYKTKMCPIFLRERQEEYQGLLAMNIGCTEGTCATGGSCRFAHSLEDLRPLPDLSKTKLCSSYSGKGKERGKCALQPHCPFAHSPSELRTSSSVFYKVALCKFYKNDKCWNGPNCRFAHGTNELRYAAPDAPAVPARRPLHFPRSPAFFNAADDAPAKSPVSARPPATAPTAPHTTASTTTPSVTARPHTNSCYAACNSNFATAQSALPASSGRGPQSSSVYDDVYDDAYADAEVYKPANCGDAESKREATELQQAEPPCPGLCAQEGGTSGRAFAPVRASVMTNASHYSRVGLEAKDADYGDFASKGFQRVLEGVVAPLERNEDLQPGTGRAREAPHAATRGTAARHTIACNNLPVANEHLVRILQGDPDAADADCSAEDAAFRGTQYRTATADEGLRSDSLSIHALNAPQPGSLRHTPSSNQTNVPFSFSAKHEPSIHPSFAATILDDSNSAAQAYVHFVLNSTI